MYQYIKRNLNRHPDASLEHSLNNYRNLRYALKFHIFVLTLEKLFRFVSNPWQEKISTSCGKVYQWLSSMAGRCFSLGTPVSSTNKTDRHDMTEILLKVALNTITITFTIMSNKIILAGSGSPSVLWIQKW
jgi:hypothetical protein